MWRYAHLNNVHGPPRASGDDPAVRLVLVFVAATRFFHHCFLGFFTFFQGVLVAVSLTRIFLILKVKKLEMNSSKMHFSADGVQPARPWETVQASFGGAFGWNHRLLPDCYQLHALGLSRYNFIYTYTRSLGALWAPTCRLRPFGLALGPSDLLDNVLHALRALRPCDPRNSRWRLV